MPRLFRLTLFAIALLGSATLWACAQETSLVRPVENTATIPLQRSGSALKLHEKILERGKGGPIDILFLGDSITQGWTNKEAWERYYAPRNAANFGIGGDRTQHVLWRLNHGEIEGISPKLVVLMIGTNNMNTNTPEEIAEGIKLIIDTLRAKLPDSKILLLGVLPRGQKPAPVRDRIKDLNERIAMFDDGKMVKFLDIGHVFLSPDGTISRALMPDFLHLSDAGYQLWAEAMEPTLWELTGDVTTSHDHR
jgi:lysophospholipase L1-like esterase